MKLILTCEHAGKEIPAQYASLFVAAMPVLETHRGYDPGALDLFRTLKELAIWQKDYKVTRLLIEPNRSLHHQNLFSQFSRNLSEEQKNYVIKTFYLPYRNEVEENIRKWLREGESILHLSVHSFTPELNGEVRNADVGLLYDPARAGEKEFSKKLKAVLAVKASDLRIRFNYPYLGKADGFTTHLRRQFENNYTGIELEVNQKFVKKNKMDSRLKDVLYHSLQAVLEP